MNLKANEKQAQKPQLTQFNAFASENEKLTVYPLKRSPTLREPMEPDEL